jgi:plastocyanin
MDARSASALAQPPRSRRILASPALAIAAILIAGAGSVALAADAAVSIANFAFVPNTVTVVVGDTVTWTNNDEVSHTATADGGSFDTGSIGNGASDSVTFNAAGTFAYHCSIHPTMSGTVIVQAAAATATPPPGATPRPTAPGTNMVEPTSAPSTDNAVIAILAASGVAFGIAAVRMGRRARI